MKEKEGLRCRAFKIVFLPVVGMTLEPYTLQIDTRIISKVSYLLTNNIIYIYSILSSMIKERDIFPSHFFTVLIRLLF